MEQIKDVLWFVFVCVFPESHCVILFSKLLPVCHMAKAHHMIIIVIVVFPQGSS